MLLVLLLFLALGINTVGWRHYTPMDTVEIFTGSGQLLQIQDKSGLTHSLGFDGKGRPATVTDSYGRQLQFGYNAEGTNRDRNKPGGTNRDRHRID